jgi:hypothetical protein
MWKLHVYHIIIPLKLLAAIGLPFAVPWMLKTFELPKEVTPLFWVVSGGLGVSSVISIAGFVVTANDELGK